MYEIIVANNNQPMFTSPESADPIVSKDDPDPYNEEFHIPIANYKHRLWELN